MDSKLIILPGYHIKPWQMAFNIVVVSFSKLIFPSKIMCVRALTEHGEFAVSPFISLRDTISFSHKQKGNLRERMIDANASYPSCQNCN